LPWGSKDRGTGLDYLSGTIQYDDTATSRYTQDGAMGKPLANGGTTYYRGKLKDSCPGGLGISLGLRYSFGNKPAPNPR